MISLCTATVFSSDIDVLMEDASQKEEIEISQFSINNDDLGHETHFNFLKLDIEVSPSNNKAMDIDNRTKFSKGELDTIKKFDTYRRRNFSH